MAREIDWTDAEEIGILLQESSSRQRQSLRAGERREAVWGLVRRRCQSGLAQMAA